MQGVTRRSLLVRGVGAALGLLGLARTGAASAGGSRVSALTVRNAGRRFAADRPHFATINPRSAYGRNTAMLDFSLDRGGDVVLEVANRNRAGEQVVSTEIVALGSGPQQLPWQPKPSTPPGTYILRLREPGPEGVRGPVLGQAVVRVLDVEAMFTKRSALPGETVSLVVASDAPWLRLTLLRCGPETEPTYANGLMRGVAVGTPTRIDLAGHRDGKLSVPVQLAGVSSGVHTARLEGPSGHLGFAPIVVRPTAPEHRVAVVMPTTTWQAYNFYDRNGDGFGDTWYALWAQTKVRLLRPHVTRGVPYRFRSYDLGFLHWLVSRGHDVDYYADEDLEHVSPDALRAAYDLVVFPGHTEYVTPQLFDVVERYRDLGGNLLFLSANNMFRHVEREGETVRLIGEWRAEGRPESRLLGVQYLAGDRGKHQAPFVVVGADQAPWAFAGTGLSNGSQFGRYGIEIDARTPDSPPGTVVLATIPDLFGPGRSGEMTYYETPEGARVFSAGVLNFGGGVMLAPAVGTLLDNVWARLTTG